MVDSRKQLYEKIIAEQIEALHAIVECAGNGEPPISFIDSLALTSLSRISECINGIILVDESDYRMRFFLSNIRSLTDRIAIRLLSSMNADMQLEYYYPVSFPHPVEGSAYDWIEMNLEKIESEDELPADIDSTFSALHALMHHASKNLLPPSSIFAHCLKNIESARRPECPHLFNTWFEPEDATNEEWESADIVAMSSVVAFFDMVDLSHMAKTKSHIFEKLTTFLRNPIEAFWFSDFYHSLPMAIYMISRCHWDGMQKSELADHIQAILAASKEENALLSPRLRVENDTDRLLYVVSLLRLGRLPFSHIEAENGNGNDHEDALRDLINDIASISLEKFSDPLFIHDMKDGKTAYAASPILSALFKFETLFGIMAQRTDDQSVTKKEEPAPIPSPYSSMETGIADAIRDTLTEFEALAGKSETIDSILASTDFMICLDICRALMPAKDQAAELEEHMLAHALGLCTYFLYDKIYDQELHAHTLPVLFLTNSVFQMHIQRLIERISRDGIEIPGDIEHILADTDISYFLMAQRDGDVPLSFHAKKSIGNCLVPILAMLRSGMSHEDACSVMRFFEHFNLARQISDDAKDESSDAAASDPKITTMRLLHTQAEIEYELFKEIILAKQTLDSLPTSSPIKTPLQKHLDAFAIKVIRAKWEFSIVKNM